MKCFYHQSVDGVGLCKSCQKALCVECAADVGGGLACRTRCEETVRALNSLVQKAMDNSGSNDRALKMLRLTRGIYLGLAVFVLIIGAVFTWWATRREPAHTTGIALGVLFMVGGSGLLAQALRMSPFPPER